jgi:uncharacterized protein YpmS
MRISPEWKILFIILVAVTTLLCVTVYRLKSTPGVPHPESPVHSLGWYGN